MSPNKKSMNLIEMNKDLINTIKIMKNKKMFNMSLD